MGGQAEKRKHRVRSTAEYCGVRTYVLFPEPAVPVSTSTLPAADGSDRRPTQVSTWSSSLVRAMVFCRQQIVVSRRTDAISQPDI